MHTIFDVTGKNILITGTSSGLGEHIAHLFAASGANIIMCARRRERLEALHTALEQQYQVQVYSYSVDVNQREQFQQMLQDLEHQAVCIDVLINNAGVSDTKKFLDYQDQDQDWDKIVGTNLKAPWLCSQEIAQHFIRHQTQGAIINITSILSQSINLGVSPYCASKAGLKHLTEVMAVELARYKIRVNAIAPGYMLTEINQDYLNSEAGQQLIKKIPLRRFVEFEDLDGALLLLASNASQGMTGVEIKVDAGHSCTPI